ncbi:hypothetical protein MNV49_000782 [Pseudohyphozyma bogoriensis]|nr:hypothetical protein MNV49_000782 [Pseudohyphozyma bogoriensis]
MVAVFARADSSLPLSPPGEAQAVASVRAWFAEAIKRDKVDFGVLRKAEREVEEAEVRLEEEKRRERERARRERERERKVTPPASSSSRIVGAGAGARRDIVVDGKDENEKTTAAAWDMERFCEDMGIVNFAAKGSAGGRGTKRSGSVEEEW